jgi:hypothetical protein
LEEKQKLNCKLEENKELKLIILAETPWISDAQKRKKQNKLAYYLL